MSATAEKTEAEAHEDAINAILNTPPREMAEMFIKIDNERATAQAQAALVPELVVMLERICEGEFGFGSEWPEEPEIRALIAKAKGE